MPAISYLPTYTIGDYLTWKGDWELWNGSPVAMSSLKIRHQDVAGNVFATLRGLLANQADCETCRIVYEIDWHVDEENVVRPDISLICAHDGGDFLTAPPCLVVEVLSKRTREKDLGPKRELYAQQGVRHYLVLDPENNTLLLWTDGEWRPCQEEVLPLDLDDECSIELPVPALFA